MAQLIHVVFVNDMRVPLVTQLLLFSRNKSCQNISYGSTDLPCAGDLEWYIQKVQFEPSQLHCVEGFGIKAPAHFGYVGLSSG